MDILVWLQAYATVYVRRLSKMDRKTLLSILVLIVVAVLASALGPAATMVLGVVIIFVLPAINADVRSEVDAEYKRRR